RKVPLFTRKGGAKKTSGQVHISACLQDGKAIAADVVVKETVASSRWAAWMVDTHPAELSPADFVREAKKFVKDLNGVRTTTIVGDKLLEQKLGGIHAVGRGAAVAPRLLVFEHKPKSAAKTVALVGKGVIFDTGGLSLKATLSMCSMKGDMGGAAAVLGAFRVAVASGNKDHLICAVALVENAIGPNSYRNDDIVTMHSGHTVEINNTDAEGRLLLGDGVSYVARKYKPDLIVDAATLTGAQLVATGLRHAAITSSREGVEQLANRCGHAAGELVHTMLFTPEFHQLEFKSEVADFRNSVSNRSNAQSSCAAWFVWAHIDDLDPAWIHIDLAGPSWRDGRGTGFGVGLISRLLRDLSKKDLV
ncbi:MAG: leucyl aminopeptidase family protein, partial [Planctomycetes bacterium]|nr:leucyl aminopeptidase family protein [Planctomycetota bacterium]